jgi:2-polyprenyl-6-methoxyphenol hydroxylase-like FAD-dependent oxidoreductase
MAETSNGQTSDSDEPVLESGLFAPAKPAAAEIVRVQETTCCVVGGGPAGVILSYLLARSGVRVTLLEAHKDFDRKFRGDTIHPSVLEVLDELGLADKLHELRHTKLYGPTIATAKGPFRLFDLRRLKTKFPYVMLIPQVDFLDFMVAEARRCSEFQLEMGANVHELVEEDGVVRGVRYRADDGIHEVRADVTIGADGRHSRMRHLLGFEPLKTSAPMDVLWFHLPMLPDGPPVEGLFARPAQGRALILFERADHLQVGYIFAKGRYQELKKAGLKAVKQTIVEIEPRLERHMASLTSWRDLTLLSVESNRCRKWYREGVLLIGDAAHVMTPVGGVGINYAIHDAVEAANVLAEPLRENSLQTAHLRLVQKKRERPTKIIQRLQSFLQGQLARRVLNSDGPVKVPLLARLAVRIPFVRDIPARILAFGIGRSHVQLPNLRSETSNT